MLVKAFFAFPIISEATRGVGAWSLDVIKSGRRRPDATGTERLEDKGVLYLYQQD